MARQRIGVPVLALGLSACVAQPLEGSPAWLRDQALAEYRNNCVAQMNMRTKQPLELIVQICRNLARERALLERRRLRPS